MVTPDARRGVVRHLQEHWKFSERQACRMAKLSRTVNRYERRPDQNESLRQELRKLAEKYPRLGAPMLYWMLRNQGWQVNHKRVERLYRQEKLALRRKRRRKFSAVRLVPPRATSPMECLALDFMSDATIQGRKLRILTVIDEYSKLCPSLTVNYSLTGEAVVEVLTQIASQHGFPNRIRMDNGPEFRSRAVIEWALLHRVALDYIQPGKPTQNAFIESFNGRLREECLDQQLFLNIDDARRKVESWRKFYNEFRPHSALGGIPPSLFAQDLHKQILLTGT